MSEEKKIRWRAMSLDPLHNVVVAIPFVVDPYEDTEEPEENEDGSVNMVQFNFSGMDFALIRKLIKKQTDRANIMSIQQMEIEHRVNNLMTDMLGEYMKACDEDEAYSLQPWFKEKAEEILAMEVPVGLNMDDLGPLQFEFNVKERSNDQT